MAKPMKIGLVGFGNIGTGVVRHLREHGAMIDGRLPRPVVLKTICDKDLKTDRGVATDGIVLTDDYRKIVGDPEIELVIELVGGTGIANAVEREALSAGKHVVTANKALISKFGRELFELADRNGAALLYEASVGAGIPIIRSLQTGVQPNRLRAVHGILNGTCNFILSSMEDKPGTDFEVVLKEAMRLGYAEPDPTLDIEGNDTAHKLCILGSLAFGADLRESDIELLGITRIRATDFEYAREAGQTIKLLATASKDAAGELRLSVWPTFVPLDHLVGRVRGVTNTILVEGDPIGSVMFAGPGAGQGSTSSGVLSDVMLVAQAGSADALRALNPLRFGTTPSSGSKAGRPAPRCYVRVATADPAGASKAAGLPALRTWKDAVAFAVPEQSADARKELLGKLLAFGVPEGSICEIRYALQPQGAR